MLNLLCYNAHIEERQNKHIEFHRYDFICYNIPMVL